MKFFKLFAVTRIRHYFPRCVGGNRRPCWRTSRDSHPSEDLSELPPLLVTVAGQEYHY